MRGTVAKRIHSMVESAGPTLTWPKARKVWNQFCGRTGSSPHFPAAKRPMRRSSFMGWRGVGKPKREWNCGPPVQARNIYFFCMRDSEGARKNRGHGNRSRGLDTTQQSLGLISAMVQSLVSKGKVGAALARLVSKFTGRGK